MDHAYTLQQLLKSKHGIQAKTSYIEKWLRARPPRVSENRDTMLASILEHFLCQDLQETSIRTIPSNFGNTSLESFPPGPGIVLQIVDTRDITNSTHSLLNNLATVAPVRQVYVQRASTEDIRFPRGTLRWILTDGYTEIVAMEEERIHNLELTTPFGIKLFIKPSEVRSGILFLKPSNVKVMGGEVKALFGGINGSMLEELERRFKAKLGLPPPGSPSTHIEAGYTSPQTSSSRPAASIAPVPATPASSTSAMNNNYDDHEYNDDDFGLDDEFYDDLGTQALMELEASQQLNLYRTPHEEQLPISPPQRIVQDFHERESSFEGPLTQRLPDERTDEGSENDAMSFTFEETTIVAAEREFSPMEFETSHITEQASQLSLQSDDELDHTAHPEEQVQPITNPTVAQVEKYLDDMMHDRKSDLRIADQITVDCVCLKVTRIALRTTSTYIVVNMRDSGDVKFEADRGLHVKLPTSFLDEELGIKAEEVGNKKEEYIQTVLKPWGKSYRNVPCKITLDLTVVEKDTNLDRIILDPLSYEVFDSKTNQMKIYKNHVH